MTRFLLALATCLTAVLLAACGGGGGVGSGGTGITVGGGGVGSGGTGIGIGPISGFGSIVVNGTTYDIDSATIELSDVPALALGMTVEVTGSSNADFSTGTATRVRSSAELRGPVTSIDLPAGTLLVQGSTASVDTATVFVGLASLAGLAPGDPVMIHGLPDGAGLLRATRIEKLAAAGTPVVTGVIATLNPGAQTFALGALTVQYAGASFVGGLTAGQLADGLRVRVRAALDPVANVLVATSIQAWYATGGADGSAASLSGVVSQFASLGSFRLLGQTIDASQAQISGGPAGSVGNGVRVEVQGNLLNGVLVASRLKIRHVPGTGGPASFSLEGTIGAFVSSADFRVKGQPVDASGGGVVFSGGSAASLGNGVKVQVVGSQVLDGRLIADSVTILP